MDLDLCYLDRIIFFTTGTTPPPDCRTTVSSTFFLFYRYYASARLWDDGIIQIEDTRKVLAQALRVVSKNMDTKPGEASYGVFRT